MSIYLCIFYLFIYLLLLCVQTMSVCQFKKTVRKICQLHLSCDADVWSGRYRNMEYVAKTTKFTSQGIFIFEEAVVPMTKTWLVLWSPLPFLFGQTCEAVFYHSHVPAQVLTVLIGFHCPYRVPLSLSSSTVLIGFLFPVAHKKGVQTSHILKTTYI